jgi:hypothetical protein
MRPCSHGTRACGFVCDAREVFLRLAILHLGRELAVAAYPDAAHLTP